ncbi:MAG: HAMP domain-containing histidine kinase [Clostridia bacterium]|nr:HAMP domain-containing histidine kinase [Clostridia bacterium]
MKTYQKKQPEPVDSETLATIAHDLRTPMSSVAGAAQLAMLQAKQGLDVDRQLRQILQAVHAMDRMLSDMCGADGVKEQDCKADMLARELRTLLAPRAEGKHQRLIIDLHALSGRPLAGDYARLVRVLSNLLVNAVKFTPEGGEVSLTGEYAADGAVVFAVRDSGMGMRADFMARMYRPYERASGDMPGQGLGLSIVRRLVRDMGGEISVSSEWGRGTVFIVRLPAERACACQ